MTRRHACLVAIAAALAAGCEAQGQSAAPDGRDFPMVMEAVDRHAPSRQDLGALTYYGTEAGTVSLDAGVWHGISQGSAPGIAELALARDFLVIGDITGNGTDEAVVLLEFKQAPAVSLTYLAVVSVSDGQPINIATLPIAEDLDARSGRIEPGRIILSGVRRVKGETPANQEAMSVAYALEGGTLRRLADPPPSTIPSIGSPASTEPPSR